MKNIRNLFVLIFSIILLFVGVQSCSQYPETNTLKLVSNSDRVSKAWKVDNYKINGVDCTSQVFSSVEAYTKDGVYSSQGLTFGGTGTWAFQNNNTEIQITGTSNLTSRTLFILRLEDTQFWYYYMSGTDKKEFHFVRL